MTGRRHVSFPILMPIQTASEIFEDDGAPHSKGVMSRAKSPQEIKMHLATHALQPFFFYLALHHQLVFNIFYRASRDGFAR